MDAQFYIDRAFGHLIFINVKDGVITDFPHEGKMEDKLNERYAGKSISEFKTEFEEIMKPSFHCVKSLEYTGALQTKESIINRIQAEKERINRTFIHKRIRVDGLIEEVDAKYSKKLDEAIKEVVIQREILEKHHNFYLKS